jgi:hypothetical protein
LCRGCVIRQSTYTRDAFLVIAYRLVGPNNVHQGVVLKCTPLRPALANYLERADVQHVGSAPLWVALDEVWDPHVRFPVQCIAFVPKDLS